MVLARYAPDYLPYAEGWLRQLSLHEAVSARLRPGGMILCEHESVYTAGARTRSREFPKNGAQVVRVGRGGKLTWHGPGQLVGYPILYLGDTPDVVRYVRQLEEGLILGLKNLGINGFRVEDRSGVWCRGREGEEKIAAIGVRVQKNTTLHGFALNCSNELKPFENIIPCGIEDAGVTTISRQATRTYQPKEVADLFTQTLSEALGYIHAPA